MYRIPKQLNAVPVKKTVHVRLLIGIKSYQLDAHQLRIRKGYVTKERSKGRNVKHRQREDSKEFTAY